jgi:hypothetical protein
VDCEYLKFIEGALHISKASRGNGSQKENKTIMGIIGKVDELHKRKIYLICL